MTERKRLILTFAVYVCSIFLASVFFILLFHTALLKNLNVFFYRGCFFILLAAFFSVVLMFAAAHLFKSLQISAKDFFCVFFLFSGFTLGWFVLGPTTVERSISVFMLSYMEQNDEKGIDSEAFGTIFYQKYISDFAAFDKRFQEQVVSKNIKFAENEDGYVITKNGRLIVNIFRLMSKLFNTEKWLVYPNEYGEKTIGK